MNDPIAEARARGEERLAAHRPIDYDGVNRHHPKQRAALTRAVNSGDPERVKAAVVKAVREWGQAPYNGAWPDDWSRWQRALDDALPWGEQVLLEDIR
jgi:hypothetical protein